MKCRTLPILLGAFGIIVAGFAGPAAAEKKLRVGLCEMPATKGNAYGGNGPPGIFTWAALYDYVTFIDSNGAPQPRVAKSWTSDDGQTWRMTLAPGQMFHNGRPLTSGAITESVDFLLSEDGKRFSVSRNIKRAFIASVTALDDLTVEFKLSKPNPVFPSQIAALPVYEPRHFADVGIDAFTIDPVGSGPFKLDRWTGNGAELIDFEDYRTGRPKIDRIELIEIPEGAARLEGLISAQIDIDIAVFGDDFERIRASGASINVSPAPRIIGISLLSSGQKDGRGAATLFADVRVGKAVNYAVNKQAMIDTFLGGIGRPAS